mgnify:CR=1 FL=1
MQVTDEMVSRFLAWRLPVTFSPDCGISFDGRKDDEWNKNKTWPTGTNLLTRQIEAVREGRAGDAAENHAIVLVCVYMIVRNATTVAKWANAQGWRMPGAAARKGRPANLAGRDYVPEDIMTLAKTPPAYMPPALVELMKLAFRY